MERHRSAALGLLLALTTATTVATAQSTEAPTPSATAATKPATDSAAKAAADSALIANAIPAFFRDIQANAFVSFGDTYNLNSPTDQLNGLRFFDNRSNSLGLDGAELVIQKAVAKAGDAGFRIDLVAGRGIGAVSLIFEKGRIASEGAFSRYSRIGPLATGQFSMSAVGVGQFDPSAITSQPCSLRRSIKCDGELGFAPATIASRIATSIWIVTGSGLSVTLMCVARTSSAVSAEPM